MFYANPPIKRRSCSQPQNLRQAKIHVVDICKLQQPYNPNKISRLRAHKKAEEFKAQIDESRKHSIYELYKLNQKSQSKIKIRQYSLDVLQSKRRLNIKAFHPEGIPKQLAQKKIKNELAQMLTKPSNPIEIISQKINWSNNTLTEPAEKNKNQQNMQNKKYSNLFMNISRKWLIKNRKLTKIIQINRRQDLVSPWPIGTSLREQESELDMS